MAATQLSDLPLRRPIDPAKPGSFDRNVPMAPRSPRYYATYDVSNLSSPLTPSSSLLDPLSGDNSLRSSRSSTSPIRKPTTEETPVKYSTFPGYSGRSGSLPSPHLPLRKGSANQLRVNVNTKVERTYSSETISPTPSPRVGRFTPVGSPRQLPERSSASASSPLATVVPRNISTHENYHQHRSTTATDRDSVQWAPPNAPWTRARGMTASSSSGAPSPGHILKSSTSIPDLASLRAAQRGHSSAYRPDRGAGSREPSMSLKKDIAVPWREGNEAARSSVRSVRSAMTNTSAMTYESSAYAPSDAERSSVLTEASSFEIVSKPTEAVAPAVEDAAFDVEDAIGLYADFDVGGELEQQLDATVRAVEDFMEARKTLMEEPKAPIAPTEPVPAIPSNMRSKSPPDSRNNTTPSSSSPPDDLYLQQPRAPPKPPVSRYRAAEADVERAMPLYQPPSNLPPSSQSPRRANFPPPFIPQPQTSFPQQAPQGPQLSIQNPPPSTQPIPDPQLFPQPKLSSSRAAEPIADWIPQRPRYQQNNSSPPREAMPRSSPPPQQDVAAPPRPVVVQTDSVQSFTMEKFEVEERDRYGFKKASQYITVEQYDDWNEGYVTYLERRQKKWDQLMRQYGLSTENPIRFPPKSDKVKRYIRKGVPPQWRGAAWFWYAGGPDMLARDPGLYRKLVGRAENGELSETDKDIIERDLNRTFPDNIKFKPDPVPEREHAAFPGKAVRPPRSSSRGEPKILGALRRVLQAFAIHNTNIGYCQSLNFLAGLLLIFLDEDEEKAFILLSVITNQHMPGTHAKVLEANVDIGVLMSCIRESMPAVWVKIDDSDGQTTRGRRGAPVSTTRLPTVSLATTSWFMSCFVGNLPIESVLRVWDSLFYEGSKTLFRISLAIFKWGEQDIRGIGEQLEIFQVVQSIPRKLIDINALMESCFKRRNGFGHLSQETIDVRRRERRVLVRQEREERERERARMVERMDMAGTSTGSAPPPAATTTQNTTAVPTNNTNLVAAMVLPPQPEMDRRATDESVVGFGEGSKQGALSRAASRARALRDQSRNRKKEKANNWTDTQWRDAN